MRLLFVTALALHFWVSSASAGMIRHDRDDALYTGLAENYPSVGLFVSPSETPGYVSVGSGVLIKNPFGTGEHWVLTAAHVLDNPPAASEYEFDLRDSGAGVYYGAEKFTHPDWAWAKPVADSWDIGLMKLSSNVTGVTPAVLNASTSEVGQTATLVGYGTTGNGLTGDTVSDFDWKKRAGTNVLDHDGSTIPSPWSSLGATHDVLWTDFDSPDGPQPYGLGDSTPTDLEIGFAGGTAAEVGLRTLAPGRS